MGNPGLWELDLPNWTRNSQLLGSSSMHRFQPLIPAVVLVLSSVIGPAADAGAIAEAERLLPAGLIVHLGCGDGKRTVALRSHEGVLVHGLDTDPANIRRARDHIEALGVAHAVTVDTFDGTALPYVDSVVNLLVADTLGAVADDEVMRVLAPGGAVVVGGARRVKPRPDTIDEWTHYLHAADNNAVATDALVGPPRRVRWKAGPTFTRHHDLLAGFSALVSTGGRIFYIIDEAPTSLMSFPPRWRLVARDAFNGILLWKRRIPNWANHLRPFRSGPPQLPRRLVAAGGNVYVTLALNAPVSRLSTVTGKTHATYAETAGADEIMLADGILVVATIDAKAWQEAKAAGRRGVPPAAAARSIVAVDAGSGRLLWRLSGEATAGLQRCTLAVGGDRVVFQAGREVRCVDLRSGESLWRREIERGGDKPATGKGRADVAARKRRRRGGYTAAYYAPTLVIASERDRAHSVVLSADRGRLVALDAQNGAPLWNAGCTPDFHAPADLFVADALVWSGLFGTEGRNLRTGAVERRLDIQGLLTPGHHPRCYRNKATDRFIISNKRGLEFFDLTDKRHARHNWVRGVCQYGVMPCNGLVYVPPNPCCCFPGAQLHGFYALASGEAEAAARPAPDGNRLVKGKAYGFKGEAQERSGDWPTFRGDGARRGAAAKPVQLPLATRWEAKIGGRLSQAVVAGGTLLVASREAGSVTALEAASGRERWTYRVNGRVDSPPTIHRGLALFGATDGWVHCLRVADGELAWRFRAVPDARLTVVDERLESVWPLHGSVLVHDGVAYAAAGRSCYLDGGIRLCGLDPATGRKLSEARVAVDHAKDESAVFIMAGAHPDVLVTDGKYVYLQQLRFNRQLVRKDGYGRHLLCHSGLTDDTWFYRTFWRLGHGDAYDFPNSYIKHDLRVPFGQLLVFNDRMICGVQTHFSPKIVPTAAVSGSSGCLLFGDANSPLTPDKPSQPDRDYPEKTRRPLSPGKHKWTAKLPFQARAMVLTGERLLVAGWPDTVEGGDLYGAIDGRAGGELWIFAATTGEKLGVRKLPCPPVFDGLIAANGQLYLSTRDGRVLCFGAR